MFSTFCSSVLALLTVAAKLPPCISDFIIGGEPARGGVCLASDAAVRYP